MIQYFNGINIEDLTGEQLEKYKEVNSIKLWFNTEYTMLEQKYRRLRTLNKLCEDGSNPENKLIDLYKLAELKRAKIQSLGG